MPNNQFTSSVEVNTILLYSGSTATLYNSAATTVNAFGAATAITMGATSGSMTLRNPTITLAPGAATTTLNQTGIQLVFQQSNAGATLIDFYPNPTDGTSNALFRFNRLTNTSGSKQTLWYSGDGTTKLSFALTASTSAPLIQLYNGNATVNVTMAGSSGDITTAGDIAVNGGDLTSSASTFNVAPTSATVNVGAAATTVTLGDDDADVTATFGRARFYSSTTDELWLAHIDNATSTAYALRQTAGGVTVLNTKTGTSGSVRVNNAEVLAWSSSALTLADAINIATNTSTGSKIGTAATQKIGFWNATPVVQPSSTGETTGYTGGGGTALTHTDTFTGNSGTKAYTINDLVKHLKTIGLLAAS